MSPINFKQKKRLHLRVHRKCPYLKKHVTLLAIPSHLAFDRMLNNSGSLEEQPVVAELVDESVETTTADSQGLQNRLTVLAILFFVTGALGLPLLWVNRRFSIREQIIWSLVVTLYTALLIWGVAKICWWSYQQFQGM